MKYIYTLTAIPTTTATVKQDNKTVHRAKNNRKNRRYLRRHGIEML